MSIGQVFSPSLFIANLSSWPNEIPMSSQFFSPISTTLKNKRTLSCPFSRGLNWRDFHINHYNLWVIYELRKAIACVLPLQRALQLWRARTHSVYCCIPWKAWHTVLCTTWTCIRRYALIWYWKDQRGNAYLKCTLYKWLTFEFNIDLEIKFNTHSYLVLEPNTKWI